MSKCDQYINLGARQCVCVPSRYTGPPASTRPLPSPIHLNLAVSTLLVSAKPEAEMTSSTGAARRPCRVIIGGGAAASPVARGDGDVIRR